MPYIKPVLRTEQTELWPDSAGELNYAITKLCLDYIKRNGGMSYAIGNEVVGVLECAKLEFYRRKLAPYEDKKIKENGDIEGYGNG